MMISTHEVHCSSLGLIPSSLFSQSFTSPRLLSKARCKLTGRRNQRAGNLSQMLCFSKQGGSFVLLASYKEQGTGKKASGQSSSGKWIVLQNPFPCQRIALQNPFRQKWIAVQRPFHLGGIQTSRTGLATSTSKGVNSALHANRSLHVCCNYGDYHDGSCSCDETLSVERYVDASSTCNTQERMLQLLSSSPVLSLSQLPSAVERGEKEAWTLMAGEGSRGDSSRQPVRTLLIDNYDSYTYNLYQMLGIVNGDPPLVIRNDEITAVQLRQLLDQNRIDNIVISPGPGTPSRPSDIGICSMILEELEDMPILGVCLGHQALGYVHGASVVRAPEPVHGRLSEIEHMEDHPLFKGIPSGGSEFKVVRYHSLIINESTLPDDLIATAWTVPLARSPVSSFVEPQDGGDVTLKDSLLWRTSSEGRVLTSGDSELSGNDKSSQSRSIDAGHRVHCIDDSNKCEHGSRNPPGRRENGRRLESLCKDSAVDWKPAHGEDPGLGIASKQSGVGIGTISESGRILMAISHKTRPHHGVQFHPESIATVYGERILQNFADLTVDFWHNRQSNDERSGSNHGKARARTAFSSICVQPAVARNRFVFDYSEAVPQWRLQDGKDLSCGQPSTRELEFERSNQRDGSILCHKEEGIQGEGDEKTSSFPENNRAVEGEGGCAIADGQGKSRCHHIEVVDLNNSDAAEQGVVQAFMETSGRELTERKNTSKSHSDAVASAQERDSMEHLLVQEGNPYVPSSKETCLPQSCPCSDVGDTGNVQQRGHMPCSPVLLPSGCTCRLVWAKASDVLGRAGDSEAVFIELFGSRSGKDVFWLDSAITCEGRARFSFMGGPGGPMWRQITYTRGVLTVCDSSGDKQQWSSSQGILHHLEQELDALNLLNKEDTKGLPFLFFGGFVGYLGYEIKAECGALSNVHASDAPDAAFFFADRFVAIDHRDGDVYAVCLYTEQGNAQETEEKPRGHQHMTVAMPAKKDQEIALLDDNNNRSVAQRLSHAHGCEKPQSVVALNGCVGEEVDTERREEPPSSAAQSNDRECFQKDQMASNVSMCVEGGVGEERKRSPSSTDLLHCTQEAGSDNWCGERELNEVEKRLSSSPPANGSTHSQMGTSDGCISQDMEPRKKEESLPSSDRESALAWVDETVRRIGQLAHGQVGEGNRRTDQNRRRIREKFPLGLGNFTSAHGGAMVSQTFKVVKPQDTYMEDVKHCLDAIYSGDSYEVCLTTSLISDCVPSNPLSFYQTLRKTNPAPYAAWLNFSSADLSICCSSPERFLRLGEDGILEAKPIKGTLPRGMTEEEDEFLKQKLMHSKKDNAENLMIVDLLRNDLGRVCELGSVHVPRLMDVETYATVHQLVSTIRGKVRGDVSPVDCVRAAFPGGSMTGAPKLRTMQILDEIEGRARGVYSGSIGFFSINRTFDFNIVIRTAVVQKDKISIGAGGAVVALSDSHEEYLEMLLKTRAILMALDAYGMCCDKNHEGGDTECDVAISHTECDMPSPTQNVTRPSQTQNVM